MRMTRLTGVLATAVVAVGSVVTASAAPAAAQEDPCANASANVGCGGSTGSTPSPPSSSGSQYAPIPVDWKYFFDSEGTSEGSSEGYEQGCWGIQAVPQGQGTSWEEAVAQQSNQGDNGVAWGNCDVEDTIDPAELIRVIWERTVTPPPPTPLRVQPGRAVTGLRSYLEIGGEVPHRQTVPTPIGPASFEMTPRYVVSWGDGASESTESQGVAWPGGPGEISHVYTDAGDRTLTVQAFWRTTWSLAGQGGDLPELPVPTEGSLDLPVEQYQVTTD